MTQDQTSMTDSSDQASVSPSSPCIPAFGKPSVVNAVQRWLVGFMGINPSFWAAVNGTKESEFICFQAIALIGSSSFFGMAVGTIAADMLNYSSFRAFVMGTVAGACLLIMDRFILILLRTSDLERLASIQRVATGVRLMVVGVLLMASVLSGINTYRDAIDQYLEQQAKIEKMRLASDPRFLVALESAKQAVADATKAVARKQAIQSDIQMLVQSEAKTLAEYRNQCAGATSLNGIKRIQGCGPKAEGAKNEAESYQMQRVAAEIELNSIGEPNSLLSQANARLDTIGQRIAGEVARGQTGVPVRVEAFGHMLAEHPVSAGIPVLFWFLVSVLFDIMLIVAYFCSKQTPFIRNLNGLVEKMGAARLHRMHLRLREESRAGLVPLEVRLS